LRSPRRETVSDVVVLTVDSFYPFQAPFKRPDDAVFRGGGQLAFPVMEDPRNQS
jgi:hypothetical protein